MTFFRPAYRPPSPTLVRPQPPRPQSPRPPRPQPQRPQQPPHRGSGPGNRVGQQPTQNGGRPHSPNQGGGWRTQQQQPPAAGNRQGGNWRNQQQQQQPAAGSRQGGGWRNQQQQQTSQRNGQRRPPVAPQQPRPAVAQFPNLGRLNNPLPPQVAALAQPISRFGTNPPSFISSGDHQGLYQLGNTLFISPDRGRSFIPVEAIPGSRNQFEIKDPAGNPVLVLTRGTDGSFQAETPNNQGDDLQARLDALRNRGVTSTYNNIPADIATELGEMGWTNEQLTELDTALSNANLLDRRQFASTFNQTPEANKADFATIWMHVNPQEKRSFINEWRGLLSQNGGTRPLPQAQVAALETQHGVPTDLPNIPTNGPVVQETPAYNSIPKDIVDRLSEMGWSSERLTELNAALSNASPSDRSQFSTTFTRTPSANRADFVNIWMNVNPHEKGTFVADWKRLIFESNGAQTLPEARVTALKDQHGVLPELPTTPTDDLGIPPTQAQSGSSDDDLQARLDSLRGSDDTTDNAPNTDVVGNTNNNVASNTGVLGKVNGDIPSHASVDEKRSGWEAGLKPEATMIQTGENRGLYPSEDATALYISRDGGQSFIEVKPTANEGEFVAVNSEATDRTPTITFNRQRDGSFTIRVTDGSGFTPIKIPQDIANQIEKMGVSTERKESITKQLERLSQDDMNKFTRVFRLTNQRDKNDLLFTWSAAKSGQKNELLDAWLSKENSDLPLKIEEMFDAQRVDLPASELRKIHHFMESLNSRNLSSEEASQLARDHLTKKYPNAFPADGPLIKVARVGKSSLLFIGTSVLFTGLGIAGYAIYNEATSSDEPQKTAIFENSNTHATVYGAFPNNLVLNDKSVKKSSGEVIGKVDNLGNIIASDGSGNIIKPNGDVIGKYDDNNNIVDSSGNIRSPSGEILATKGESPDSGVPKFIDRGTGHVAYLDGNNLVSDETYEVLATNVRRDDDGNVLDSLGNRIADYDGNFRYSYYTHAESGETVEIKGNSLVSTTTGNEVASNINTSPRWELKVAPGAEGKTFGKWYYYPLEGNGYFVDKPGSATPETLGSEQKEAKDIVAQFNQGGT